MSGPDRKEQIDADILQSRADVVRSRKKTPLPEGEPQDSTQSQKTKEKADYSKDDEIKASEGPSSLLAAVVKANKTETARTSQADIPRFDLAEEIMAQQRKITAIKRKAPGAKTDVRAEKNNYERRSEAADYGAVQEIPANEDLIVADIVTRDIERLLRGD